MRLACRHPLHAKRIPAPHTHTHTVHKGERDHENPGAVKQGVIWNLELCVCVRVYMCVRVRVYACARERECDLVSFYR